MSIHIYIYIYIGGWGGESNREIDFGFVFRVRDRVVRAKLCAMISGTLGGPKLFSPPPATAPGGRRYVREVRVVRPRVGRRKTMINTWFFNIFPDNLADLPVKPMKFDKCVRVCSGVFACVRMRSCVVMCVRVRSCPPVGRRRLSGGPGGSSASWPPKNKEKHMVV